MRPIGIFDSGIGGLTVARAISQRFPNHPLIYFGDTAHLPFGEKSPELIRHYATRITKELVKMDCAAIVVACNSASSNALDEVRMAAGHSVPVIDVIYPVVESVSREFVGDVVGVIGTRATIDSGWYQRLLAEKGCTVKSKVTPLLASAIEEGFHEGRISTALIEEYLTDDFYEGITALVLGCTHYPLISDQIQRVLPPGVKIVDSAEVVADELNQLDPAIFSEVVELDATHRPLRRFIVSDLTQSFQRGAERFFGSPVILEELKLSEHEGP